MITIILFLMGLALGLLIGLIFAINNSNKWDGLTRKWEELTTKSIATAEKYHKQLQYYERKNPTRVGQNKVSK